MVIFFILMLVFPIFVEAKTLPVLNKNLKFGEPIKLSDISYMELDSSDWDVIDSEKYLVGSFAKATIQANQPIKMTQLKMQPVIRKNEPVNIIFIKDNVKLQSKGVALENGSYNNLIMIKNLYNSKKIVAKVLDKNSVVVQ